MLRLLIQVSWLISILVIFIGAYEATPLQVVRVPLMVGGSILCQRGRQVLSFVPLDMGVTYLFHTPFVLFGLANLEPVP